MSKLFLGESVLVTDEEDDFYNRQGIVRDTDIFEGILHYIVQFENTQERHYTLGNIKPYYNEGVI